MVNTSYTSPNFGPRRMPIALIVLHATVGDLTASLAWLTNPVSRVSAHYLISKTGVTYQLVRPDLVAWHAGRSAWRGCTGCNAFSIGIELVNANDGRDPYPGPQLTSLTALVTDLLHRFQLAPDAIARHLDIALPPGRKTDPAGFPWDAWRASLPPLPAPVAYRVRADVTAGARIRTGPWATGRIVGVLAAHDPWCGRPVTGDRVTLPPFGTSDQWVRADDGRCVWAGLLERDDGR